MGMSTHVIGFRPPDEKWEKMKSVWDSCKAAGTAIPDEVLSFFNHEEPDENGVEVVLEGASALREWSDDYRSGFEVDVVNLPKGLEVIRFYNSY